MLNGAQFAHYLVIRAYLFFRAWFPLQNYGLSWNFKSMGHLIWLCLTSSLMSRRFFDILRRSVVGSDNNIHKLGLFGMLKLVLALQFIVMNAYFSVACNTKVSIRATLK